MLMTKGVRLLSTGARSPIAVLVLGVSLSFVACIRAEPDEQRLAQVVAEYLVNDELSASGKIAVFDSRQFSRLPEQVREAVVGRLDDYAVRWVEHDLHEAWRDFPGTWTEGRHYRYNETHIRLSLSISGRGRGRLVEWARLCGPSCGRGARVELLWDGERWVVKDQTITRY